MMNTERSQSSQQVRTPKGEEVISFDIPENVQQRYINVQLKDGRVFAVHLPQKVKPGETMKTKASDDGKNLLLMQQSDGDSENINEQNRPSSSVIGALVAYPSVGVVVVGASTTKEPEKSTFGRIADIVIHPVQTATNTVQGIDESLKISETVKAATSTVTGTVQSAAETVQKGVLYAGDLITGTTASKDYVGNAKDESKLEDKDVGMQDDKLKNKDNLKEKDIKDKGIVKDKDNLKDKDKLKEQDKLKDKDILKEKGQMKDEDKLKNKDKMNQKDDIKKDKIDTDESKLNEPKKEETTLEWVGEKIAETTQWAKDGVIQGVKSAYNVAGDKLSQAAGTLQDEYREDFKDFDHD